MAGRSRVLTDEQVEEARVLYETESWTLRALSERFDASLPHFADLAKREGWVRATGGVKGMTGPTYRAIREQAEDIIATEVARRTNEQLDELVGKARQDAIVAAAAQEQARVMELHRSGATRVREMMEGLLRELGVLSLSPEALLAFAQVVSETHYGNDDEDFDAGQRARDKAMQAFIDLLGLNNRADVAKKLVDSFAKVVDMERRVYGIKEDVGAADALEALKMLAGDGG